jgi:hypothetical protein
VGTDVAGEIIYGHVGFLIDLFLTHSSWDRRIYIAAASS